MIRKEIEELARFIVDNDAKITRQAAKTYEEQHPDDEFNKKMRYQYPSFMDHMTEAGKSLLASERLKEARHAEHERSVIARLRERISNF